jgi:hypothetical protein
MKLLSSLYLSLSLSAKSVCAVYVVQHLGSLHFGHCGWFSVRQQDLHSEFNIFLKRRGD